MSEDPMEPIDELRDAVDEAHDLGGTMADVPEEDVDRIVALLGGSMPREAREALLAAVDDLVKRRHQERAIARNVLLIARLLQPFLTT